MGSAPRVIAVLGMHRSGTSCLAGTLMECGIYFGNVSRINPYNEKGNNENLRIMALHEDLLQDNGGSWYDPPEVVRWSQRHLSWRDEILQEYDAAKSCWGFKDPRTLLTFDGWQDAIPLLWRVGVFRHPDAVVQSLLSRNPDMFTPQSAAELWYRYNRKLLSYAQDGDVKLIEFDAAEGQFLRQLKQLIDDLRLEKPTRGFEFFETRLRHCQPRLDTSYPGHVLEVYEELRHKTRQDLSRETHSTRRRMAA